MSEPGTNLTDADAAALGLAEPSITFLPANQPSTSPNEVSVDASEADRWVASMGPSTPLATPDG